MLRMTPPADIPPDQMQRIQPVLDQLLADLRAYTKKLPASAVPAVDYEVESGDRS